MTDDAARIEANAGRPVIRALATGVPGLDAVLGGGLPEYSFNLVAGEPGAGKTTLAQQIMFANATAERPALYFTLLGEPTIKMLRYQRQFGFFRPELVGSAVQFLNLSTEVLDGDLGAVLERIVAEVERTTPGIVVVDSFRTIGCTASAEPGDRPAGAMGIEQFVQRLALHLTTWEVTSLLLGDYVQSHQRHPVFTVADGALWLSQAVDRNSVVRKLQVTKVRGHEHMPGLHTFRMSDEGVQVFPRIPDQQRDRRDSRPHGSTRLSTGVPGLDEMMGGGIPSGDAVMLAGPTGTGKTTFGMQFVSDGLRKGEPSVIAVFEEYPEEYLERLAKFHADPEAMVRARKLKVIYLRPLDLSVDETLAEILDSVHELEATRVVIDSLSGFEIALAPTFREDFRESLYRLVGALTATGVTVVMTAEVIDSHREISFTGERVSFITDDIVIQRYVEMDGELRKMLAVVKMRGSQHSRQFRAYEITGQGVVVGEPLTAYHGLLTGVPDLRTRVPRLGHAGLTTQETATLDALVRLRVATADALATQLGVPRDALADVLERLVTLDYAIRIEAGGEGNAATYRAVVRMAGQ